jgi:hypothetical protein
MTQISADEEKRKRKAIQKSPGFNPLEVTACGRYLHATPGRLPAIP